MAYHIKHWWDIGRNDRVPNENEASWVQLIQDDLSQLTHSDRAFQEGKTSVWSLRPLKAFSPRMLQTGPTPLVRQLVERPFKFLGCIVQR